MAMQQKCALEVCTCQARIEDGYCSDYCKQAASHEIERDFCQCSHQHCEQAIGKFQTSAYARLPESVCVAAGRVTIDCSGVEDLLDQLLLLTKALNGDRESFREKIESPPGRRFVGSEPLPLLAKAESA